jgi:predicted peptidase
MKLSAKITALIMALVMCMLPLSVSAKSSGRKKALPTSAGIQALRDEFDSDVAPEAGGYALDYAYYSPVGENDNTKYPLVIFLHGIGHADYVDAQLDDSDFPYWASAELQSEFSEGGAFVLLPRAPEHKLVYWSKTLIPALRSVIDDMIAKHGDNIDTTKIFIGGSSAGGEMTWDMIIAFPEYFAGAFPIAATGAVSEADTKKCRDVAVWMLASELDPVVSYVATTKPLWNNVCKNSTQPENCRLSSFKSVKEPSGKGASDNHHLAKVVTYDLHMLDGSAYPDVSHQDGLGNGIALEGENGMISWMNGISSDYNGNAGNDSGNINVNGLTNFFDAIRNFFLKIVNIFQRLFGL